MGSIRTLLKESFAYGFAGIVSRFIGFLLMPLYTNILTPEDYGVLNVINITIMLCTLFSVLALDGATHIFFWDYKADSERQKVFSSWFWSQFSISIILAFLLFLFANPLSSALFRSTEHADKFRLASLILISGILPTIIINWFRVRRLPWPTTWYSLIMSLITICLNIWFIAFLRLGIKGFFLAQIISGALMSLIAIVLMRQWLSVFKVSSKLLQRMLKYSLPIIPTPLAYWSLNFAGSYFLQVQKGEVEVGLFQTGSAIASIILIVVSSFTQAWGPFAMSIKDQPDSSQLFGRILILYTSVAGFFAVLIGVFSQEILILMTAPEYTSAHFVTSVLVFNSVITGLNFIAALGLNFVKNMKPYSVAIITGAVVNLCLYGFVIRFFGKEGCAVLTLISNIFVAVWIFHAAQKRYFIPYNFQKAILIFLVCMVVAGVGKLIPVNGFWSAFPLKIALLLLTAFILLGFSRNTFKGIMVKLKVVKRSSSI